MSHSVCLIGQMLSLGKELLGTGGPSARPLYRFDLESHGKALLLLF